MNGMQQVAKKDAQNFYIYCLKKTSATEKPLECPIKIASGYYLYDTGTNKILECEKEVFDLLHGLFFKDVSQAIDDFVSRYRDKGLSIMTLK